MELLRLQDLQLCENEHIFKESPVWALFIAIFFGILPFIPLSVIFLYEVEKPVSYVLIFSGCSLILFAFVFINAFIKSLSPENWLIRLNQKRIIIKFRSYLNQHLPKADKQIVVFSLNEIKEVKAIKEGIKSTGISRGTKIESFTYLEITLKTSEVKELKERLNYERDVRTKTLTYHHYPVNLHNDNKIRVEWKSAKTRVTPGIYQALEIFSDHQIKVKPKESDNKDYQQIVGITKEETEERILDLVQKGDKTGAIILVKKFYNFNTTDAVEFVRSLQDK